MHGTTSGGPRCHTVAAQIDSFVAKSLGTSTTCHGITFEIPNNITQKKGNIVS